MIIPKQKQKIFSRIINCINEGEDNYMVDLHLRYRFIYASDITFRYFLKQLIILNKLGLIKFDEKTKMIR